MHEMSTMVRLVDLAQQKGREQGAERILRLSVSVGAMTGILPYYLQKYFPEASKGTLMEGAQLQITEVPVTVKCSDCGEVYSPDRATGRKCPGCGSIRAKILTGRDIRLDSIEVEGRTEHG